MYESRICGAVDLGCASFAGWDGGYELFECFAGVYYKQGQLSYGGRDGQWDLPISDPPVDIVELYGGDRCEFVVSVGQRSLFLGLDLGDSLCRLVHSCLGRYP